DREPSRGLVPQITGDSLPFHDCVTLLVLTIVVISSEAQLRRQGVCCDGVREMAPRVRPSLFRTAQVGLRDSEGFERFDSNLTSDGLPLVVVHDVVRAVDNVSCDA